MPEEVAPQIYRIEVPLPKSPLKAVNCYVIKTADRPLIVDTGMDRQECRDAMRAGLADLDVDPADADFFITHLHSDHIGLVWDLAGPDSTVHFNPIEAEMMTRAHDRGGFGSRLAEFAQLAGFSDFELQESMSKHPGLQYKPRENRDWRLLDEGDRLEVGEYAFDCVHTPGHSPGHLCLYDASKKLMICGDHVLGNISPNISSWDEDDNPLGSYLHSLDKVREFDVEIALPGHRGVLHDFKGRVDELKAHHDERLREVEGILDGAPLTGYDVASRMKWRLRYDKWEDVAVMQKWFATGEAVAHLRQLEVENLVRSEVRDGLLLFTSA